MVEIAKAKNNKCRTAELHNLAGELINYVVTKEPFRSPQDKKIAVSHAIDTNLFSADFILVTTMQPFHYGFYAIPANNAVAIAVRF